MKLRAVLSRMVQMRAAAWSLLIRSIQLSCVMLICALVLLFAFETGGGKYVLYIQSRALQEYAQVAMLIGAIIPVVLEDL